MGSEISITIVSPEKRQVKMRQKNVTLGRTGIISGKNAFGALPIQRISKHDAVELVRKAYDAGFTYFDTARMYTDSEEKLGAAFEGMRDKVVIASKTRAMTPEAFWAELETSLRNLRMDYIDIHQFHDPKFCPKPGDGSGLYEAMQEAKRQGKIRHISITSHSPDVAEEAVNSGLYDTLQFPFCYLSTERDVKIVELCREKNVGFICMKALSGGLITSSAAAYAFLDQYDNALPIWGIQRTSELDEFISYIDNAPELTPELEALIERDRKSLAGAFCRGCAYCAPCPKGIVIQTCARMSQLIRRAPSADYLTPEAQEMMLNIENCTDCRVCMSRCPYGLEIPPLLKKNLDDYREILAGRVNL